MEGGRGGGLFGGVREGNEDQVEGEFFSPVIFPKQLTELSTYLVTRDGIADFFSNGKAEAAEAEAIGGSQAEQATGAPFLAVGLGMQKLLTFSQAPLFGEGAGGHVFGSHAYFS